MSRTCNGGKYKAVYEMRQVRVLDSPQLQDIAWRQ